MVSENIRDPSGGAKLTAGVAVAASAPPRTIPLGKALLYIILSPFLILVADRASHWLFGGGGTFQGGVGLEHLALILGAAGLLGWLLAMHLRLGSVNGELTKAELHFRTLYNSAPLPYHSLDTDGRIVEVNEAWRALLGGRQNQVFGLTFESFLSGSHQVLFRQNFAILKTTGRIPNTEYNLEMPGSNPITVSFYARAIFDDKGVFQQAQCILIDMTERRQQAREVERLNRLYAVLSQVNQAVVHSRSRQEVFDRVCTAALSYGGFKLAWVGWLDPQTRRVQPVAHRGAAEVDLKKLHFSTEPIPEGLGPTGTAIREAHTVICNNLLNDPSMAAWHYLASDHEVNSVAAFPIRIAGEVCGALVLYAGELGFFQAREILLLEEAASDVSFALNVLQSEAQRHQAEAALQASEARHRFLAENITDVVWMLDVATMQFLYVSPSVERLRGFKSFEVMKMGPAETMLPGQWSVLERSFQARKAAFLAGDPRAVSSRHEFQQPCKDGSTVWTEAMVTLVGDAESGIKALGVSRNITQRKRAEEALSLHENRLNSIFRALPSGVGVARNRVLIEVNARVCEMSGYTTEELLGQSTRILYAADEDFDHVRNQLYDLARDRSVGTAECRWRRKNGEIYDVVIHSSALDPADPAAITFTVTDVTALKLAEARIDILSQAVEQSPVTVVITDLSGAITYVNARFTQVTGYEAHEVLGKNPRVLKSEDTPAEQYADVWCTITSGGQWRGQFKNRKKNGEFFWELACISPIRDPRGAITHFLAVKEDITERKRLEERFLRSQRMESIGTLASGVAHDLNNILAPIMLAIDVLREGARSQQDAAMLQMLAQGSQRGAGIVKQLLMFGRGVEGNRAVFSPQSLLKEMVKVIRETFPKTIALEQRFPGELWPIHAEATQIHQVLLNLCVNARDAMPHGGKLTIAAENAVLNDNDASIDPEAKPGPYLVLRVSDTGTGIRPELLDKIFDPFFTTKEPGKGTGLGLSTVLGIVKGHGGFVQIASKVGQGTQFAVFLPAAERSAAQAKKAPGQELPQGNGELVLVVDDEEAVCIVARRTLEKYGYRVLTVQNGAEGIVACSQHRSQIQVVLTDMVMPIMDGASLIRVLGNYSPEVRIIAMTGLSGQEDKTFKPASSAHAFLSKPFTAEQLLTVVSQVLKTPREVEENIQSRFDPTNPVFSI